MYVVAGRGGGSYEWLYRNQAGQVNLRTCAENESQIHNSSKRLEKRTK